MSLLDSGRDDSPSPMDVPMSRWEFALGSRRTRIVALALVLLVTFLVYSPTLFFGFVYDDTPQIVQNPHIHEWSHWFELFHTHVWAQQFGSGNYYRPLFLLAFLLEYSLFGLHTFGWHLISVVLHLGSTVAVYFLVAKFIRTHWAALLAALLFGIHPIHVESVAWVSAVSDPLSAIFMIASVICYINFRNNDERRTLWLLLSIMFFACAILTKETAIIVLPILALYEWLFGANSKADSQASQPISHPGIFFRMAPLLLFLLAFGIYLVARIHALGAFSSKITVLPWQTVAYTAPRVLLFYCWQLVWPFRLSLFYDVPYSTAIDWHGVILPALAVLLLAFVLFWIVWRCSSRSMLFGICWILLPLLPVMDFRLFPAGDVVHDRYLYLPTIGLALFLAVAAERFAVNANRKFLIAEASAAVIVLLLFATGTVHEALPWANNLTLYSQAVEQSPHLARARTALANELFVRRMYPQAIAEYKLAIEYNPNSFAANYNLGIIYKGTGQPAEAENFFSRAADLNPNRGDTWINLGLCRLYQRKLDGAEAAIVHALDIDPSGIGYHTALGDLRMMQNNSAAALAAYQEEISLHPDQIEARIKAANIAGNRSSHSSQKPD